MSSSNEGRIPVIDISGSVPQSEVAKQLVDAAATFGFVYIKNLGKDIPVDAIDRTFELSQKFFSSPVEEKLPCKIANNNRGWSGMHTEKLDEKNQRVGDFKEAFNLGDFVNGKAEQPLPPSLSPHESELNEFQLYCHKLCLKLLTLFAIGLEIDPAAGGSDWFSSRHHGGTTGCILRLLYYPSLPPNSDYQPDVDIRAGAHSDYGSITLLFQRPSQPGLEILPPSSSSEPKWTPVPIQPPTTENDPSPPILVNIGDLLSHWTNNLLVSTVHRVIFPKSLPTEIADRYSIAYFCHPVGTTVLESVPSERVQKFGEANGEIERKKGEKITADEHLMGRLRATYAGLYEEDKGDKKE
ncbi:putative 2og-fe oxygenase protein [Botrytis fragariae]|uniref:Putative 2og-fe oxygenase protein n=1 Tax=Botrytis fragariae TaxID=1964551 RepID=A0A8H6EM21_9HELO|nr:putative 2og-fe oxygenase protein [Botrytis fragariae]KAF5877232.1 putative 2og-fe oxygenase protein [Botrytis fragariae]